MVEEQDINIDSQGVASWDIDMVAPYGGTYLGAFKFRTVLSPIQEIEADRDYRDLLGKNAEFALSHIENLAYALSQLRHRVISGPPFWFDGVSRFPGSHIRDKEVLEKIFEAAFLAEKKYRKMLNDKHKTAIERMSKFVEEREKQQNEEEEKRKDEREFNAEVDGEQPSKNSKKAKK